MAWVIYSLRLELRPNFRLKFICREGPIRKYYYASNSLVSISSFVIFLISTGLIFSVILSQPCVFPYVLFCSSLCLIVLKLPFCTSFNQPFLTHPATFVTWNPINSSFFLRISNGLFKFSRNFSPLHPRKNPKSTPTQVFST